jgi:hypothetical protein
MAAKNPAGPPPATITSQFWLTIGTNLRGNPTGINHQTVHKFPFQDHAINDGIVSASHFV